MNIISNTLIWGLVIGLIHFVVMSVFYKNPIIDKIYLEAQKSSKSLKKWNDEKKYLISMFLGTQIEIYILIISKLNN